MKIVLTLLCTIVINFSMPLVTPAEQHLVQSDTSQVGPTQNRGTVKLVKLQATADAARDASQDVRMAEKYKWVILGLCAGAAIGGAGALIAHSVADARHPIRYKHVRRTTEDAELFGYNIPSFSYTGRVPIQDEIDKYNQVKVIGYILFSVPSLSLTYIGFSRKTAEPLPERLLGKSPEYIEAYTQAYKAKNRNIKRSSFFGGTLLASGCILLGLLNAD